MTNIKNFHVVLATRPGVNGSPTESNFSFEECNMPREEDLCEGEVLIKTCYLSVDPALRCMMNEDPGVDYLAAWQINQRIIGSSGLGVVQATRHPDLECGDLVVGGLGWPWASYAVINYSEAMKRQWMKLDKDLYKSDLSLSLMSLVALTSLIGLWEKGHVNAEKGQTLVVSGAAGACGSLAGQMGKLLGCSSVIGICGSEEKRSWLTQQLGFDAAINYKSENVEIMLRDNCPNGVDIYFDNVGGDMSDTVISQMKQDSHIVLCGQISQYNKDVPYPPPLKEVTQAILKSRNITRERFLVLNYQEKFTEALSQFLSWVKQGKLQVRVTMEKGLENTGKAFVSMMNGGNFGKQLVHVSDQ